jgi:hypothetical protein
VGADRRRGPCAALSEDHHLGTSDCNIPHENFCHYDDLNHTPLHLSQWVTQPVSARVRAMRECSTPTKTSAMG